MGELFGFERTRMISGEEASAIAAAAKAFGQEDDITVLTVARRPLPMRRPRIRRKWQSLPRRREDSAWVYHRWQNHGGAAIGRWLKAPSPE